MGSLPPQIVTHNIGVTFLPFRSSLLRLEHREMVMLITRRLCTFLTSTVSIVSRSFIHNRNDVVILFADGDQQ